MREQKPNSADTSHALIGGLYSTKLVALSIRGFSSGPLANASGPLLVDSRDPYSSRRFRQPSPRSSWSRDASDAHRCEEGSAPFASGGAHVPQKNTASAAAIMQWGDKNPPRPVLSQCTFQSRAAVVSNGAAVGGALNARRGTRRSRAVPAARTACD